MSAFPFMVLVGLGLYLPYVAVHTTVFERLLAMTRDRGNVGFLLYVADSFGYLGYVAVMLRAQPLGGEQRFSGLLHTGLLVGSGAVRSKPHPELALLRHPPAVRVES
jgi:hypothetical protein